MLQEAKTKQLINRFKYSKVFESLLRSVESVLNTK